MDENKREKTILGIADMMRAMPFQVEFRVKKKPAGMKIIIDVTKEYLEGIAKQTLEKAKRLEPES